MDTDNINDLKEVSERPRQGVTPHTERLVGFLSRYGTVLALVIIIVLLAMLSPRFLSAANLSNILVQISTLVVVAAGLTIAVAAGEFDLSVGAVAGLAGVVVTGLMVNSTGSVPLAIVVGLGTGAAVGMLNGLLVSAIGLPSLIATLGMISIVTGVNLWYTKGRAIYGGLPDWFAFPGRGSVAGIPVPIIIMVVVVAVSYILLERTAMGRHLYTIGANRDVARLAGIAVSRDRFLALVFSGVCAALAGIVLASRLGSGQPSAGDHFLMSGLAAVFLGMTAFNLGQANIKGTVVGAMIIGVLSNGFNLLGLPFYAQDIATGAVMIAAVTMAVFRSNIRLPSVRSNFGA
jgi:ribose/xylose/arabinose/galactoside ABC-type transport system permease subunit